MWQALPSCLAAPLVRGPRVRWPRHWLGRGGPVVDACTLDWARELHGLEASLAPEEGHSTTWHWGNTHKAQGGPAAAGSTAGTAGTAGTLRCIGKAHPARPLGTAWAAPCAGVRQPKRLVALVALVASVASVALRQGKEPCNSRAGRGWRTAEMRSGTCFRWRREVRTCAVSRQQTCPQELDSVTRPGLLLGDNCAYQPKKCSFWIGPPQDNQ